jgi:hypothetical protein
MTMPEDRLPALAGVASKLQDTFRGHSLAGLWKECLIRHVGWYHVRFADYLSRNGRKHHLIPNSRQSLSLSWSWCSFKGEVRFDNVVHESAEIIECTTVLVNSDLPFGQVHSGILRLRAPLARMSMLLPLTKKVKKRTDGPESLHKSQESIWLLLIGYAIQWSAIGLMIEEAGNQHFTRIGQVYVPKAERKTI